MIDVFYGCEKCGIKEAKVAVVERPPRENVVDFVNRAALQCKADHDGRSPDCEIGKLSYLKIPVDDDTRPIGSARRVN